MSDENERFEAELAALVPSAPAPELALRIEAELRRPASGTRPLWWAASATLPIAAALALLVSSPPRRPAPPASKAIVAADMLKPVSAENVLYAAADEGLVTLDDGTTARRERLHFVDTVKWQNPRTHASLTWSMPREEVRVVPVRYQ